MSMRIDCTDVTIGRDEASQLEGAAQDFAGLCKRFGVLTQWHSYGSSRHKVVSVLVYVMFMTCHVDLLIHHVVPTFCWMSP